MRKIKDIIIRFLFEHFVYMVHVAIVIALLLYILTMIVDIWEYHRNDEISFKNTLEKTQQTAWNYFKVNNDDKK